MNQPQHASNRRTLWGVAVAAGTIGFGIGFAAGWTWRNDSDAHQIPCPSCRIERGLSSERCELVGQIAPDWPAAKSPLVLMPPFAGDISELQPGACFRLPVPCPGAGAELRFNHPASPLPLKNDWCSSGCLEKMTCSP